ncbi:DUF6980 family protein [Peribacillus sp. SCS-155]|uniref:DUF6980 family protein n=1 Tax=Peribacillus sedimenti TaxID=3115297 RepID=UPI0039060651
MKKQHCCEVMTSQVNHVCEVHDNPFDCPDHLVYYNEIFDEYSLIIHDGGSSTFKIDYCPWCGIKLPESKRDLWFATLETMGFESPFSQDIPQDFYSDKWYNK